MLEMKKYFRIHDYIETKKAKIVIYNLNGRAAIWWEHLRHIKYISERIISWSHFKRYFKEKYLSVKYYNCKRKVFHELKLGQKTMDKHAHKFLELLSYVDYIKSERVYIQIFLRSMPQSFIKRIEFFQPCHP